MKINIISCANSQCGIGRYTDELARAMYKKGEYVRVFRKDNEQPPLFNTYPYRSLRSLRHYVAPYYLSKIARQEYADVWLADYVDAAFALSLTGKKNELLFTNVHDAIPFLFPTSKIAFANYKMQLKKAADQSRKLIVVSETSKRDLVEAIGIDPGKVEVIYNGINHDFFYPDPQKKKNDLFTIRYVGGLSGPHKNAETLIEVARILEQQWYGENLVIEIGGGHPENTVLPELVKKYDLKSVKFKGFIPDSELRQFLSEADLFLYPSKYEGFGFPPLEAMACGTATVSSNAGSLGEVLAGGAITVDPDPASLANAVIRVIEDKSLKSDMEQSAVITASKYTWQKAARAHVELFKSENEKQLNAEVAA